MRIRGILCGIKASTDEEYKKILKRRIVFDSLLILLGIFTIAVTWLIIKKFDVEVSDHTFGFYTGVGTGFIFGGVVLLFKHRNILLNNEKLRRQRIVDSDERIIEINNRAIRTASLVLLLAVYVTALVGGLFYPHLTKLMALFGTLFLLTYIAAYQIYDRNM